MLAELWDTMMSWLCMKCTVSVELLPESRKLLFSLVRGYTGDETPSNTTSTTTTTPATTTTALTTSTSTTTSEDYDYAADEAGGLPASTSRTYSGDDESVDDHIRKNKNRAVEDDIDEGSEDICSGRFDAVAHIRNELFVFVKTKLWRFSHRGILR